MQTLALATYLDSAFGTLNELPSAGTPLENPYVYDTSAWELKAMGRSRPRPETHPAPPSE